MNDLLIFIIENINNTTTNKEIINENLKKHVYADSEDREYIHRLIEEACADE